MELGVFQAREVLVRGFPGSAGKAGGGQALDGRVVDAGDGLLVALARGRDLMVLAPAHEGTGSNVLEKKSTVQIGRGPYARSSDQHVGAGSPSPVCASRTNPLMLPAPAATMGT